MYFKKLSIFIFCKICKRSVLDSSPRFEHNLPNVSQKGIGHGHFYFVDCWCFTTFSALKCSAIIITPQYIILFYSIL